MGGENLEVRLRGVTEGNREERLAALRAALSMEADGRGGGFPPRCRPWADKGATVRFNLHGFRRGKIEKAMRAASLALGVPVKSRGGEGFVWRLQEELSDRWCAHLSEYSMAVYDFVAGALSLPKATVVSKGGVSWRGRFVYNPDTGLPMTRGEWDAFVKALDRLLSKKFAGAGERIALDAVALSKILNRMAKCQTFDEIQAERLDSLRFAGRSFAWISESVRNMESAFGEPFSRAERARLQVMSDSAAQRVTGVTDAMRNGIKQTLIDGARNREGKSRVSQRLFDMMAGDNRDIQRIVDTETQSAANWAAVRDEVARTPEGEKTYFRRVEIIDSASCDFCRRMNGKIAVYSDIPLASARIDDPVAEFAIWDGMRGDGKEVTDGVFHPYCRGVWERWDPRAGKGRWASALSARLEGKDREWSGAVSRARKEFEARGVKNPGFKTRGYVERVNEIYRGAEDAVD